MHWLIQVKGPVILDHSLVVLKYELIFSLPYTTHKVPSICASYSFPFISTAGGQIGAVRYAIAFATIGTAVDFATLQLWPYVQSIQNTVQQMTSDTSWLTLPEWSPIQMLDEEALAAKRAREQQLYAQRAFSELNKEESWVIKAIKQIWKFSGL